MDTIHLFSVLVSRPSPSACLIIIIVIINISSTIDIREKKTCDPLEAGESSQNGEPADYNVQSWSL